jgi:hypothetical protein
MWGEDHLPRLRFDMSAEFDAHAEDVPSLTGGLGSEPFQNVTDFRNHLRHVDGGSAAHDVSCSLIKKRITGDKAVARRGRGAVGNHGFHPPPSFESTRILIHSGVDQDGDAHYLSPINRCGELALSSTRTPGRAIRQLPDVST